MFGHDSGHLFRLILSHPGTLVDYGDLCVLKSEQCSIVVLLSLLLLQDEWRRSHEELYLVQVELHRNLSSGGAVQCGHEFGIICLFIWLYDQQPVKLLYNHFTDALIQSDVR